MGLIKNNKGQANIIILAIFTCIMGFGMLTIGSYIYYAIASSADAGTITLDPARASSGGYAFSGVNISNGGLAWITHGTALYRFEFNATAPNARANATGNISFNGTNISESPVTNVTFTNGAAIYIFEFNTSTVGASSCKVANCILVNITNTNNSNGAASALTTAINANASVSALVTASNIGNGNYTSIVFNKTATAGYKGNYIVLSDDAGAGELTRITTTNPTGGWDASVCIQANCILVNVFNTNNSLGAATNLTVSINGNTSAAAIVTASRTANTTNVVADTAGVLSTAIVLDTDVEAITVSGLSGGFDAVSGQDTQNSLNNYVGIAFPLFGLALMILGFSVILITLRKSFGGESR